MKKDVWTAAAFLAATISVSANPLEADSLKTVNMQEVEIVSTRATKQTPVTFTNVDKESLRKQNYGLDLPFLLSSTPSLLTTSDAGSGIGYTTIRLRGTDATRINITTNGVPMNDAESHSIYWVNTPDLTSSIEDLQIQRGVGTSTNGSGAFGGSINIKTQNSSIQPYAEVSASYGSFATHKETYRVGTGLINNHWAFDARLSNIDSDGYRDRATSDLKSYFGQASYFGANTTVKFITFGGKEETYHAWDGISKEMLSTDRTYNPNGAIKDDNSNKGNTIGYYDNQIDYYRQTHYQLLVNHHFSNEWKLNVALHYTKGFGYYEEYKNGRTLVEYGLTPYYIGVDADNDGVYESTQYVKKSNLVRRKNVCSGFGGGVFSLDYRPNERLNASIGGGINRYSNDHYGQVVWVKNYVGDLDPSHEYYRNNGAKNEGNIYIKADYNLTRNLNAYVDLQYRAINYKIKGQNDKWDWTASPEHLQTLNIDEDFHFFNPKAGLFWKLDAHQSAYASVAVAHKEPTRNNYTDGLFTAYPKAEKLIDYELGYVYRNEWFTAGVNGYYMDYTNQLVLDGKLNEIGEATAENVKDSYRLGVEVSLGARIASWLHWDLNGTLSQNRIKNYTAYVSDYDADWNDLYTQTGIEMKKTTIAMSPTFMGNSVWTAQYKGFEASLHTQYVGRQYLDNMEMKENSLDAYCVSNLSAAYTFKLKGCKSITVGATVYNLFDEKYETNGYTQTAAIYSSDKKSYALSSDPRFYPMAGTNVLANVTVRF
jgi:iron complex outermembrane receptor protein